MPKNFKPNFFRWLALSDGKISDTEMEASDFRAGFVNLSMIDVWG